MLSVATQPVLYVGFSRSVGRDARAHGDVQHLCWLAAAAARVRLEVWRPLPLIIGVPRGVWGPLLL